MVLMSIEIILNAAIVTLVAFWRFVRPDQFDAQVFVIVIVTIAAFKIISMLISTIRALRCDRTPATPIPKRIAPRIR